MDRSPKKLVVEYVASLVGGLVGGGVTYFFGEVVLRLPGQSGGAWIAALCSGVAIAFLCFGVAIGAGEPVYRLGRRDHPQWGHRARMQLWKGAFLGAPAVIALLSLTEMDWTAIMTTSRGNVIMTVFFFVIGVVQYAVTLPVRLLVYFLNVPAEAVMILAMPIGAMLVAHWARPETMVDGPDESIARTGDDTSHDDTLTTAGSGRG
jgi:hypothetical protein